MNYKEEFINSEALTIKEKTIFELLLLVINDRGYTEQIEEDYLQFLNNRHKFKYKIKK